MMAEASNRGGFALRSAPHRLVARLSVAILLSLLTLPAALAALLPPDFFEFTPFVQGQKAQVEANRLTYDANANQISADGTVVMHYEGYVLHADRVIYDQKTGRVRAIGHVVATNTTGNTYAADSADITGGMKEAFIQSLTLTTSNGAVITARQADYSSALQTILTDASYSPCGLCVDSKGRKIGWQVKSARMIYDRAKANVLLEKPSLELLGIPFAWLPWLSLPDPSQPRATGVKLPSLKFSGGYGAALTVPYFIDGGPNTDIILSPTLLSRQGLMFGGEVVQRYPGLGQIDVTANGLYQFDPSAFSGVGDREWRGAIQSTGKFTPTANWTVGWSYTAFTDNGFLPDYDIDDDDYAVNQVYATHLSDDYYADLRVQQFLPLGDYGASDNGQQGVALPSGRFASVTDLAPGMGRLNVSAEMLNVYRADDQLRTYGGKPYDFGYAGDKTHLNLEAAWETQWVLPGGITASPYLGGRLDAAYYDSDSGSPSAPPTSSLLSATPIAAMDFRWPLIATSGFDTHLLEPIVQLVYRGSSTTDVGITNDNAQSFVFDDTNLFSYNRFSGSDRQETGFRANVGAHYQADFGNGGWLDIIAGQSFQLAGLNAYDVTDQAQVGTSTGLNDAASYLIFGAKGQLPNGIELGGKLQVDPDDPSIRRAGLGTSFASNGYSAGLTYIFVAADPALGVDDQHEVSATLGVPIVDYWTLNTGVTYDIGRNALAGVSAGAIYDDGYLTYGLSAGWDTSNFTVAATFNLKGPDHKNAF